MGARAGVIHAHINTQVLDADTPQAPLSLPPSAHLEKLQAQAAGIAGGLEVLVGVAPAQRFLLRAEPDLVGCRRVFFLSMNGWGLWTWWMDGWAYERPNGWMRCFVLSPPCVSDMTGRDMT